MVEQFLQLRRQLHHLALGEKLSQGDAKGGADGFQGRNGRDRVPLEDISQRGLGKPTFFRQPIGRPAPLRHQLPQPGMCVQDATSLLLIFYRSLKWFYTVDLYGIYRYIKWCKHVQEDGKMTEQELRQHRCCFTGHRPERLGMPESEVISGLQKEIRQAIADGFQTFISGMARGVDYEKGKVMRSEVLYATQENSRQRNHFA